MLQFYIDVAGYQNYNMVKLYDSDQFNEKNLLKKFEHNWSQGLVVCKYVNNVLIDKLIK